MVLVGEFWSNPTLTGTEHGTTLLLLGFEKEEAMKKERALASSYCFVLEREIKIRVERERRAKPLSRLSTHSCTVLYGGKERGASSVVNINSSDTPRNNQFEKERGRKEGKLV